MAQGCVPIVALGLLIAFATMNGDMIALYAHRAYATVILLQNRAQIKNNNICSVNFSIL